MKLWCILVGLLIIVVSFIFPLIAIPTIEYSDFLFWKVPIITFHRPLSILQIPFLIIGLLITGYGMLK